MTMTIVKLSYNSKLVPDPGLVLQTPLCSFHMFLFARQNLHELTALANSNMLVKSRPGACAKCKPVVGQDLRCLECPQSKFGDPVNLEF